MDCPRCGFSVFADRQHCPDCGWQLSRPFATSSSAAARDLTVTAGPPVQTAADAVPDEFFLSPPKPTIQKVTRRPRRPRWGRHPGNNNPSASLPATPLGTGGASAVARLPEQARWLAPSGVEGQPPPRLEIVEMPLVQTTFEFSAPTESEEAERLVAHAVAPLGLRFQAGVLDAALVLLAGGVFFGLFAALGGELVLGRRESLIYLLAGFVLASLYFGLFILLGGCTPGMQYFGLRVVTFAGQTPTLRQAYWRAFGYVVSIGSLLLGFLWACLDERRLTWHDHISQTVLTDRSKL